MSELLIIKSSNVDLKYASDFKCFQFNVHPITFVCGLTSTVQRSSHFYRFYSLWACRRNAPVDIPNEYHVASVGRQQEGNRTMADAKTDVMQGTLDLMVLKTLEALGPLHGYGIARRIEQVSENLLQLNQGTLYPALLRLQQRGWIKSEWGTSENNRKARFYDLTNAGRRQLAIEARNWERISGVMTRLLSGAHEA
jgi:PadR family transcriptional regulator, regulatory protein PadR